MHPLARRLFRSQRQSILGMDIGADGVRLAMVSRKRENLSVEWTEEIALTELQGFADYDSVLNKLRDVIARRVRGRVEVATVPPWNSARAVIEELPAMDAARFAKAAAWYFSRNHHEDMLSPVDLGIAQAPRTTVEGNEVLDGMMVSMDHVMLTGLADLCQKLQLQLNWLVPAPLCFAALVSAAESAGRQVLVLDIGAGQTRMTLSVDGNVRLVRKLKPSANEIVRSLCDELEVGWEAANHALLAYSGIGPLVIDDPDGLAERSRPLIDRELDRLGALLQSEIERSAAYVRARHGEAVDGVLIAGGLGGAPRLIERLTSDSEYALASFDPFALTGHSTELPLPSRPRFALAIGAAVMAFGGDQSVNLLAADKAPVQERRRTQHGGRWSMRRVGAAAVAAGLVVGIGIFEVLTASRIATSEAHIDELYEERDSLRLTAHELTSNADVFDLQDRIESLRGVYRSRHLFTPFFARVVDCLPEGLQLSRLMVDRNTEDAAPVVIEGTDAPDGEAVAESVPVDVVLSVTLQGRSREVDDIGRFVVALERESLLRQIEVLRILEGTDGVGGRWYDFELNGRPNVEQQDEILARVEREHRQSTPEVAR